MAANNIKEIKARFILDSRGNPTVEADVILENETIGRAAVPSGASTGDKEALELRDGKHSWRGKGVGQAIINIQDKIRPHLIGFPIDKIDMIDKKLIEIDGTNNKSQLGANAMLPVSLAAMKAGARFKKRHLYEHIYWHIHKTSVKPTDVRMPIPMMNILNGGSHADNTLDIQEFMIFPFGASSFSKALQMGTEVFHNLKCVLNNKGLNTSVGDEGGFAPMITSNNQALDLIVSAIKKAGFKNGKDVSICLDVAANELFKKNKYSIHSKNYISVEKSIKEYQKIINNYKIKSIEDPFAENDWLAWNKLMRSVNNVQIVGDDLYVTNLERLKKGFLNISSNSILIKLNQIGTVSETLDVIKFAQTIGYKTIISHRSGESEDTFIADLAVGTNSNQIKTGSLARSERVAKYNQLIRIEEELGKKAKMNKIN